MKEFQILTKHFRMCCWKVQIIFHHPHTSHVLFLTYCYALTMSRSSYTILCLQGWKFFISSQYCMFPGRDIGDMVSKNKQTGHLVSTRKNLKMFNRSGQGAKLFYVPYQTDGWHRKTSGKSDFNECETEPRFEQLCSHGNRMWVPLCFQRIHDSRKPESSLNVSLVTKKLKDCLEEWTGWWVAPNLLYQS